MKLITLVISLALAVNAISDDELWKDFKETHKKLYKSDIEEKFRHSIFLRNLKIINKHNEKEFKNYKLDINKFTDWTPEEFKNYLTFKMPQFNRTSGFKSDPNFIAPASFDWREKGAVLEVKDVGNCGSGWAFSATGGLEGQIIIHQKKNISLSEQELVDCSILYDNLGCDGGAVEYAFNYIRDNGIATENDYPYKGVVGDCKSVNRVDVKVTGYTDLPETEVALAEAVVRIGPISVAMNSEMLQSYESGIFDYADCPKLVNHAALVVGYGVENDKKYWIIKNCWGSSWGENGYFRLAKDENQVCAIGSWNTYPNIE